MSDKSNPEQGEELTIVDHLIELRDRILKSVLAILLLFLSLFYFSNDIYTFVASPLLEVLPENMGMIAIDPTSPFFAPFKLTFYVSLFLAAPYILYQLWSFIAPGLYQSEKALAIPLFISSVILFYAGIAFAYYVLFGFVFAVNSSVHSYLILAFGSADRITRDVGFYYMANAAGRLIGTLLSGLSYQIGGLPLCLATAGAMALASWLAARRLGSAPG